MTQPPHAYLGRPAHKEPPAHAPNAALLIDFDNVTMAIRSDLQTELKRLLQSEIIRGKVAVQRAYAECAEGYGFKIDPCAPRDPKKKRSNQRRRAGRSRQAGLYA